MDIRSATDADVPAMHALVDTAYRGYIARIGKRPGPMLDDYAAHVRGGRAWVAADAAGIAGLIILLAQPDNLLLDNIAVDPGRQGQGIGRALMAFAQQEARRRGVAELRLYTHETMTENRAMYLALGWEETGRAEQDGYRRVFFRKTV